MAGGLAGGIAVRRCSVGSVATAEGLEVVFPGRYGLTVDVDSAVRCPIHCHHLPEMTLAGAITSGSRLNYQGTQFWRIGGRCQTVPAAKALLPIKTDGCRIY
jgi:hypothetical protein